MWSRANGERACVFGLVLGLTLCACARSQTDARSQARVAEPTVRPSQVVVVVPTEPKPSSSEADVAEAVVQVDRPADSTATPPPEVVTVPVEVEVSEEVAEPEPPVEAFPDGPELRNRAFRDDTGFAPMPKPRRGDWLARNRERGQSLTSYIQSRPHRPDHTRTKLYILPYGFAGRAPELDEFHRYAEAFFGLEVEVLPAQEVVRRGLRTRRFRGKLQLHVPTVLRQIQRQLPADAYAMIAVTMSDLYPGSGWNYVFGQAGYRSRVGVVSFARFDHAFYGRAETEMSVLRGRALKLFSHEIGHMFGLHHCIRFACNMNGTNGTHETDRQPPHLCPNCLAKLHHTVGFNVVERYAKLEAYFRGVAMTPEADFVEARSELIQSARQPTGASSPAGG